MNEKYIILSAIHYQDLAEQVNEAIKNGYIPQGGIAMMLGSNGQRIAQAMIKLQEIK